VQICVNAIGLLPDNPTCKPKHRWRFVHAHFSEVLAISSLASLPIKAANIIIMGVCHCTALEWSQMQNQKWLTLHWHSFLEGDNDIVAGHCAHKCSRYFDYGLTLLHSPGIVQDARQEIGDAQLTLISRMWQQAYCLPFHIKSRPITPIWIDVTMQNIDCRNNKTKIGDALLTLTLETY
jgi:hypothetical protein